MIPTYEELMKPVLMFLSDGQEHKAPEVKDYCRIHCNITDEELRKTTDGKTLIFKDRVEWAVKYLRWGGLVDTPKRGTYVINDEGRAALNKDDLSFVVDKVKEVKKKEKTIATNQSDVDNSILTPEERISEAKEELEGSLASEILDELMELDPYAFESLVANLIIHMGYGKIDYNPNPVTQKSHDGGIDGFLARDRFALDMIYTQAKRYSPDRTVDSDEINSFVGALATVGGTKGVFFTTSKFSNAARNTADGLRGFKITLVDGEELARLMIEYGFGVSTVEKIEIKQIDKDFFDGYK